MGRPPARRGTHACGGRYKEGDTQRETRSKGSTSTPWCECMCKNEREEGRYRRRPRTHSSALHGAGVCERKREQENEVSVEGAPALHRAGARAAAAAARRPLRRHPPQPLARRRVARLLRRRRLQPLTHRARLVDVPVGIVALHTARRDAAVAARAALAPRPGRPERLGALVAFAELVQRLVILAAAAVGDDADLVADGADALRAAGDEALAAGGGALTPVRVDARQRLARQQVARCRELPARCSTAVACKQSLCSRHRRTQRSKQSSSSAGAQC